MKYIAGPMTWRPSFNFPAFDAMVEMLNRYGYQTISPAELDSAEDRARAMASPDGAPIHYDNGKTWGDFLARDIKLIVDSPDIDGIVVLPDWETSRGARFETFTGVMMREPGVVVYEAYEFELWAQPGELELELRPVPSLRLYRAWLKEPELVVASRPFRARAAR